MSIMKKFVDFVTPEEYKVDKKEYEKRTAACAGCHVRVKKTNSCGKLVVGSRVWDKNKGREIKTCGCVVDAKAILKNEHCDLEKW